MPRQIFGMSGADPAYFKPPTWHSYTGGSGAFPTAPKYSDLSDNGQTAEAIVYGSLAAISLARAFYRHYHSLPFDKKGGNEYRIYSLYPFFREKKYLGR